MNLLLASLVALITWFLFGKILIPFFQKKTFSKSKFAELTKVGWVAALAYIRRFALIATLTYSGLWLILKITNSLASTFNNSEGFISSLFTFLYGFKESLDNIDSSKFIYILAILSVVFILLITRNARVHARAVYDRLHKDYKSGTLSLLPLIEPTQEMNSLNENIEKAEADYKHIAAIPTTSLQVQEQKQQEEYLEFFSAMIPAMKARWQDLDVRRRIIPELEKEVAGGNETGSWKDKIFTFFTSKGLVKSVYNTSKVIGRIGLVFILLSFLVATKSVIANDTGKVVKQIVGLQLENQRKKIEQQTLDALSQNVLVKEEEWNEEDEQILDEISRQFELAMANLFAEGVRPVSKAIEFQLRANAVKEQVIQTFAKDTKGKTRAGFDVAEQGKHFSTKTAEEGLSKKYSKTHARNVNANHPTTDLGKRFRADFKQKIQPNRSVWKGIKANYHASVKSFSTSATPKEVLGMIMGESFEEFVQFGKVMDNGTVERKFLNDMLGKTGNKTAKTWMNVKMDQFTDDLIHKSYGEALGNVSKAKTPAEKFVSYAVKDFDFPAVDKIATNLSDFPPCVDHQPLKPRQLQNTETAIKSLNKSATSGAQLPVDAITDFKYHFPGQVGMEAETAAAELANSTGGGGGGSNQRGSSTKTKTSRSNIASKVPARRARSFKLLRGFRRIGGVLIGQDPTNTGKTGVDFVDISWTDLNDKMEIFLHRADGKKISVGVFDKDIIHQALAYTSDGRLITVTMVTGKPLPFLKILLHPTLVNTDLGCKAIGLDRLVDTYAGPSNDSRVKKALEAVQYQDLLYKYASLRIFANQNFDYETQLQQYLFQYEATIKADWSNLYRTMDKGNVFNNKDLSHIASKPKYYNNSIITSVKNALIGSRGNVNAFLSSMKNKSVSGTLESFLKAETEQWSGVRELPYSVDHELSFLRPVGSQNANLFPLSFMRQIVINPIIYDENPYSVEEIDENPWGFPYLKNNDIIQNLVWKGIQTNSRHRFVLNRMKSFTTMQRVFRVAMNGDLGYNFPVEKLAYLASETRSYIKESPTPTWNSSGLLWHEIEPQLKLNLDERGVKDFKLLWDAQEIEADKNRFPCN